MTAHTFGVIAGYCFIAALAGLFALIVYDLLSAVLVSIP